MALLLYASTLKHYPADLGPATRNELSSASPAAVAQAPPQFSTWPHLPLGTLVLWLHNQDALELLPCPVSAQYLSKGSGALISQQPQKSKTGLISSPVCPHWVLVAWTHEQRPCDTCIECSVKAYCVIPFLFALCLMVVLETLQAVLLSKCCYLYCS